MRFYRYLFYRSLLFTRRVKNPVPEASAMGLVSSAFLFYMIHIDFYAFSVCGIDLSIVSSLPETTRVTGIILWYAWNYLYFIPKGRLDKIEEEFESEKEIDRWKNLALVILVLPFALFLPYPFLK